MNQVSAQASFRVDTTGEKYWYGEQWHAVGDEQFERIIGGFEQPNSKYRSGKQLSGLGTVCNYAGGTSVVIGLLSQLVPAAHETTEMSEGKANALKIFLGAGGGLLAIGMVLKIIGNNKIHDSAKDLDRILNSNSGSIQYYDNKLGLDAKQQQITFINLTFEF